MKRIKPGRHALSVWPSFSWRDCQMCEKEFRREWGWKAYTPKTGMFGKFLYVCEECIPNSKDAYIFLMLGLKGSDNINSLYNPRPIHRKEF